MQKGKKKVRAQQLTHSTGASIPVLIREHSTRVPVAASSQGFFGRKISSAVERARTVLIVFEFLLSESLSYHIIAGLTTVVSRE